MKEMDETKEIVDIGVEVLKTSGQDQDWDWIQEQIRNRNLRIVDIFSYVPFPKNPQSALRWWEIVRRIPEEMEDICGPDCSEAIRNHDSGDIAYWKALSQRNTDPCVIENVIITRGLALKPLSFETILEMWKTMSRGRLDFTWILSDINENLGNFIRRLNQVYPGKVIDLWRESVSTKKNGYKKLSCGVQDDILMRVAGMMISHTQGPSEVLEILGRFEDPWLWRPGSISYTFWNLNTQIS